MPIELGTPLTFFFWFGLFSLVFRKYPSLLHDYSRLTKSVLLNCLLFIDCFVPQKIILFVVSYQRLCMRMCIKTIDVDQRLDADAAVRIDVPCVIYSNW